MKNTKNIVAVPFHGDIVNVFDINGAPYVSLSEVATNAGIRWQADVRAAMFTFRPFMTFSDFDNPCTASALISLEKLTPWLISVRQAAVLKQDKARFNLYLNECSSTLSKHWTEHSGHKS